MVHELALDKIPKLTVVLFSAKKGKVGAILAYDGHIEVMKIGVFGLVNRVIYTKVATHRSTILDWARKWCVYGDCIGVVEIVER